jgi:hypothetical protein
MASAPQHAMATTASSTTAVTKTLPLPSPRTTALSDRVWRATSLTISSMIR